MSFRISHVAATKSYVQKGFPPRVITSQGMHSPSFGWPHAIKRKDILMNMGILMKYVGSKIPPTKCIVFNYKLRMGMRKINSLY